MIDLADEDEDSRIISFMNQSPVGDGGQWDMAVNLIGSSIPRERRLTGREIRYRAVQDLPRFILVNGISQA
jgi:hypothetical protein